MRRSVSIIGGGIAGLATGCYLQMNGYDTEIFELNAIPGGLCTSWRRKGYLIDTCIHWLVGTKPADSIYGFWNELVDMESIEFVHHEEFFRVEDQDGNLVRVFTDLSRLEKEFLEQAPEDRAMIKALISSARSFLPGQEAPPLTGWRSLLTPVLPLLARAGRLGKRVNRRILHTLRQYQVREMSLTSIEEYGRRFKNPLVREAVTRLFLPDMAMLFALRTLAYMHTGSAGYPIGGSLQFSLGIARRYKALGGKTHYRARVDRILTHDDSAIGVVLESGEEHASDMVISAADGYSTIFKMLEGRYVDEETRGYYDNLKPFPSYVQVALGIARTFEGDPHALVIPLESTLQIDPRSRTDHLGAWIYNFDPTLARPGKTVVVCQFSSHDFSYWTELQKSDRAQYDAEKSRIAEAVVTTLEARFGGIRSYLEMIDVSTPASVIEFTNNWQGSFEGWLITPESGAGPLKNTLPGLRNFYMAGHWVEPGGGVPTAMLSGRRLASRICREDGKSFTTESLARSGSPEI